MRPTHKNIEVFLKNSLLSKVLVGVSITLTVIVLIVFCIQLFGIEIIDAETLITALISASVGALIGIFIPFILKK
jgi:hypothetical protein